MSTAPSRAPLAARAIPPALIDAGTAAAVMGISLAMLAHGPLARGSAELDWTSGLLVACSALPILFWRRAPFGVLLATAAASALLAGLGHPLGVPLGPTAALYLLATSRDGRTPWTRRTSRSVVAVLVASLSVAAVARDSPPGTTLSHTALAWAIALFSGERTRLSRQHAAELNDRARRAELESEQERRLATAEERARIARDLHDSAGHAINVIVVRAGAARLRHDEDPERSRAALETIEQVARQTAAEIDEIVGALREPRCSDRTVDLPPGLASLDTLVARHATLGLDVSVSTRGTPRALSSAVDHAAYRILTEALTNSSRHGTGTADVKIRFGDDALHLSVTNPTVPNAATRLNGGHGLIGMRERAALVGGEFEHGQAGDTYCVRAHLAYAGRRP